jgi:hypothetical protein
MPFTVPRFVALRNAVSDDVYCEKEGIRLAKCQLLPGFAIGAAFCASHFGRALSQSCSGT